MYPQHLLLLHSTHCLWHSSDWCPQMIKFFASGKNLVIFREFLREYPILGILVCLSSSSFLSLIFTFSSSYLVTLPTFFPVFALSCLSLHQDVASHVQGTPLSYICHLSLLLSTLFFWMCLLIQKMFLCKAYPGILIMK